MERDMRKPFPLTDVQYAYWVGREDNQVLGGIGCHAYLEFDGNSVEAGRLEAAWNQLQYHHPMLRACFTEDGMQKIQDRFPKNCRSMIIRRCWRRKHIGKPKK